MQGVLRQSIEEMHASSASRASAAAAQAPRSPRPPNTSNASSPFKDAVVSAIIDRREGATPPAGSDKFVHFAAAKSNTQRSFNVTFPSPVHHRPSSWCE